MPSTQRFVITALIVLAVLAGISYGIGVWSLSIEPVAEARTAAGQ